MSAPEAGDRGFTLIEVLVALAVFSLAALALLRLEGAMVTNAASLQDHLLGQIVARNIAVEALADAAPPTLGMTSGQVDNAGLVWRWSRIVAVGTDPTVQRIDVAVTDQTGRPAGSLTVFRPNK